MKRYLGFATALLAFPLLASGQNSSALSANAHQEAAMMKPARATLEKTIDAKHDQPGEVVNAKLNQKIKLADGTELPNGTMLIGQISKDDMQQQGMSKLALRFDEAKLKDGKTVPLHATIVGFYGPGSSEMSMGTDQNQQMPNDWTDKTLQMDQIGVTKDVDLHSKISSHNSGVFVSTKKDDVKLRAGSELQFAIAPANNQSATSAGQ